MGRSLSEWLNVYYNAYKDQASQLQIAPVSKSQWVENYYNTSGADFNAAFAKAATALANQARTAYNTAAKEYAELTGTVPDLLGNQSIKTENDFTAFSNKWSQMNENVSWAREQADAKKKEEEAEANKEPEPVVLPQEWQDIKELDQEAIDAEAPEFDPSLVTAWEGKLNPLFDIQKDKSIEQSRNVIASLFPQGGGSGVELEKAVAKLNEIDANKLEKALSFANTEFNRKSAEWAASRDAAMGRKMTMGAYEGDVTQTREAQDWQEKMAELQMTYDQIQSNKQRQYQNENWLKQEDLSKYLAELSKPKESNFWEDLLKTGVGAAASGLTGGWASGFFNKQKS